MRARRWAAAVCGVTLGAAVWATPAAAKRVVVLGANPGPIPDGPASCADFGPPRDLTFNISGMVRPLGSVRVIFQLSPAHTWASDLEVTLIAPNGLEHVLFSFTGAPVGGFGGDNSDVGGVYSFVDFHDTGSGNWWAAAAATGPFDMIPAGVYRTSVAGGAPTGGRQTRMNSAFAHLTTAQINGTWTLRFRDHCASDVGTVNAAALSLMNPTVLDYDGDGATDLVVVRNTGGGPTGEVTWIASVPPSPLMFRDGFETGTTEKWSVAVP